MLNKHLQTTEKEQNRPQESRREAVIIKITEMEETENSAEKSSNVKGLFPKKATNAVKHLIRKLRKQREGTVTRIKNEKEQNDRYFQD